MATANDLIERCQRTVHDEGGNRWKVVEEWLLWLNEARQLLLRLRMDAFCENSIITSPPGPLKQVDTIDVSSLFELALEYFMCARALEQDKEDAANQAASADFFVKWAGIING